MKETIQYVCELCGLAFNDKETCLKHEATHIRPYLITGAIYSATSNGKSAYPESIKVQFDDDAVYLYKKDRTIKEAPHGGNI